jgi:hypothetical protein
VTAMATTPVPSPMVVDATVFHEPGTRTLAVRLSANAESGYAAHLWREAYQALRKAEESGRPQRTVYASGGGGDRVAFAVCGDYQMLLFHFRSAMAFTRRWSADPVWARLLRSIVRPAVS